jgi:hypothetical protein
MQSRLLLKEERIKLKKQGEYFEAHHIVPRSMGGDGKKEGWSDLKHPNIIILTAREHYIAHALLWLIHENRQMALAFRFMCGLKRKNKKIKHIISSRMYEEVRCYLNRIGFSREQRERMRQAQLGKKRSPESIAKRT